MMYLFRKLWRSQVGHRFKRVSVSKVGGKYALLEGLVVVCLFSTRNHGGGVDHGHATS